MVILIPARISSSRLKEKPLLDLCGIPMIVRVAKRALMCSTSVYVCTDSVKVVDVCRSYGISALLTDSNHQTGTDRLAQAATMLGLSDDEIVVNLQGDEPLMPVEALELVSQLLIDNSTADIATLGHPISCFEDFISPNVVKVIVNRNNEALYFSRAPIPYPRDTFNSGNIKPVCALHHLGIYAYRMKFLREYKDLLSPDLENLEKLEQLRALYYGYKIQVGVIDKMLPPGVDTAEDLYRVRTILSEECKISC